MVLEGLLQTLYTPVYGFLANLILHEYKKNMYAFCRFHIFFVRNQILIQIMGYKLISL